MSQRSSGIILRSSRCIATMKILKNCEMEKKVFSMKKWCYLCLLPLGLPGGNQVDGLPPAASSDCVCSLLQKVIRIGRPWSRGDYGTIQKIEAAFQFFREKFTLTFDFEIFPQTCFSMRGSDWSMIENIPSSVSRVDLGARLRAQFFSCFLTKTSCAHSL